MQRGRRRPPLGPAGRSVLQSRLSARAKPTALHIRARRVTADFWLMGYLLYILAWSSYASWAETVPEILKEEGFTEAKTVHRSCSNCTFVIVTINGHNLTMLVDTGADAIIISRAAAKKFGIGVGTVLPAQNGLYGVDDPHPETALVTSISIAGVELQHSLAIVENFHGRRREEGVHFDGLLGLPALRNNHVVFSYYPSLFYFNPQHAASHKLSEKLLASGFAEIAPHVSTDGSRYACYYLPLTINGEASPMILDSGAEHTTVDASLIYHLHLSQVPDFAMKMSGVDGRNYDEFAYQPKTLAIGSLNLPSYEVLTYHPNGVISRDSGLKPGLLGFDIIGSSYGLLDTGNDRLFLFRHPLAP